MEASANRSDEECARIAKASLKRLSATKGLQLVESDGEAVVSAPDGTRHRLVVGAGFARPPVPRERLILLGWGAVPLPFALVPRTGVTYFDLRFGAHSRELDSVASELKACLEANGCSFRAFTSSPRGRGARKSWRNLLRR